MHLLLMLMPLHYKYFTPPDLKENINIKKHDDLILWSNAIKASQQISHSTLVTGQS